jgi:hypothetical protein
MTHAESMTAIWHCRGLETGFFFHTVKRKKAPHPALPEAGEGKSSRNRFG